MFPLMHTTAHKQTFALMHVQIKISSLLNLHSCSGHVCPHIAHIALISRVGPGSAAKNYAASVLHLENVPRPRCNQAVTSVHLMSWCVNSVTK